MRPASATRRQPLCQPLQLLPLPPSKVVHCVVRARAGGLLPHADCRFKGRHAGALQADVRARIEQATASVATVAADDVATLRHHLASYVEKKKGIRGRDVLMSHAPVASRLRS